MKQSGSVLPLENPVGNTITFATPLSRIPKAAAYHLKET